VLLCLTRAGQKYSLVCRDNLSTSTNSVMLRLFCGFLLLLQFNDEFVAQHYPQFESAEDLRTNLLSSTSLARMKDVEAQIQDAIVTQVYPRHLAPVAAARQHTWQLTVQEGLQCSVHCLLLCVPGSGW